MQELNKEAIKKCEHGKIFCCECRYGKIIEKSDETHIFDLCDETNERNLGYRLKVGTDYQSSGETEINNVKRIKKRTLGGFYKHVKKNKRKS
ncbi:MAG: hypothetical protein DRP74_08230 [Candidatus Omnitrophota bacterium]|nr:MAG: hypothetical protein DRP74_08230 [Candidatus Omnitrophota bacterium]